MLVTCDLNDEWTAIARRYWEEAGVADRIDLRLGPALETIRALPADEPFDFAFIDADKAEYPDYYEECLRLLRPGGLMMLDNVFRDGKRARHRRRRSPAHRATRKVNERAAADERVDVVMLAVADGITLARSGRRGPRRRDRAPAPRAAAFVRLLGTGSEES